MSDPNFETLLEAQRATFQQALETWMRVWSIQRPAERHSEAGATPFDIVHEEGSLKLRHYRAQTSVRHGQPILVCYALVNRPYVLDLQPKRSVIRRLVEGGFNVYLIDWGEPTDADRDLRLQDYVNRLKHAATTALQQAESDKLHLLGYCMGGTLSTIFTTLLPKIVRTLTLLATPIDFEKDQSLLRVWTQEPYFNVDRLIDTYGNCPAHFLQAAFKMMKPVQNYIEKYANFVDHLHDEDFVDNFFAMETWVEDNIPVAGETFREFIKCFYQQNQLVKGEYKLGRRKVDLQRITCPLLLLNAESDHLVTPASSLGILPHLGSQDIETKSIAAGHIGLAVSSKAHRSLWPEVVQWLADHSEDEQ